MLQIDPGGAALAVDRVETGLGETDFQIPGEDILSVQATREAGKSIDEGEIAIDNSGYTYTTGDEQVGLGDRVAFLVATEQTESGAFGSEGFGEGPFGGTYRVGTYRVSGFDITDHPGVPCDITLSVTDWVFSTMAIRNVWYGGENRPICGSPDAHVNRILRQKCPEINRGALPEVSATTDYFVRGKQVRDAVDELASIAAAESNTPILQRSYGESLVFEPLDDIVPIDAESLPDGSFGPLSTSRTDKNLTNWLRVSGGIDDTNNIDDEQTVVDTSVEATQSNRIITQVDSRKSELSRIEVWTMQDGSESEDGLRVRLQNGNADDTGPVAPEDTDSDTPKGPTKDEELTVNGWTGFNMPDHTLKSGQPWLIIDSPGEDGVRIGVDSDGTPAYRVYFPKPIESVVQRPRSQADFGQYDDYMDRESMVTEPAVSAAGAATLAEQAWPDTTIGSTPAISNAAHELMVGDIVPFDRPEVNAAGEFILTKREDEYSGPKLKTTFEFQQIDTYV